MVAIKQFSTDKRLIIILRNNNFFYYLNYFARIAFLEDPNLTDFNVNLDTPLSIMLENVTDNAALAFELKLDYKNGEYYRSVCDLIGGEPSDALQSNYVAEEFPNQGVFNSKSTKALAILVNLEFIVKGICYRLKEPNVDTMELTLRHNHFIRKSYKIAEIVMTTKDISGKSNVSLFDLELAISPLIIYKADYKVSFTFVMRA